MKAMTKTPIQPKYSVPEKLLEVGQEVFIYDMSFMHKPDGRELTNEELTELKNMMMSGIPFIVCSEPIKKDFTSDNGIINISEYFIQVKVKGRENIIMLPNRAKGRFFSTCDSMKRYLESMEDTKTGLRKI